MKTSTSQYLTVIILFSLTLNLACKKDTKKNTPSNNASILSTITATNLSRNSAESGGNIEPGFVGTFTMKGVCWGLSPKPDTTFSKKTIRGTERFTVILSGLEAKTKYYYRAFALNSEGIIFGGDKEFSTLEAGPTVSDIDGNEYQIVQIGSQTWMKENQKVTRYRNGDSIPTGLSNIEAQNTTTGAYSIYFDYAGALNDFGKLYNWYAMTDNRNLCPVGWHVPGDEEWKTLNVFLGGYDVAGGKMKSVSSFWESPNEGATNESGFSGLPAGFRSFGGGYGYFGLSATWGSSSETTKLNYLSWSIVSWDNSIGSGSGPKQEAVSVRCIND